MGGHGIFRPTKYKSIAEIPDDMVKTWSKRDPNNPYYKTKRWMLFKKKQILYSQKDGVPFHLRRPGVRYLYYATCASVVGCFVMNMYSFNTVNKK